MQIDIKTFTQRLSVDIGKISNRVLENTTSRLKNQVYDIASTWEKDMKFILSTPASNRGYLSAKSKWLNLHDSYSYNNGFPMMVTGHLRNSLRFSIRVYSVAKGKTISIRRWFDTSMGYDEILNKKHNILAGYKERVYGKLDESLRSNI